MPFYHYNQNNSGGGFIINIEQGLTHNVIIEAPNVDVANARAQSLGIYFDGVDDGRDCSCCGDRWYSLDEHDLPDSVPTIYGEVLTGAYANKWKWTGEEPDVLVHYENGLVVGFGPYVIVRSGEYLIHEDAT